MDVHCCTLSEDSLERDALFPSTLTQANKTVPDVVVGNNEVLWNVRMDA
jgi:hypothetical protein